jgi:hypothetical protein
MIEVKNVPPHRRVVKKEPREKERLKKKKEPKKKDVKKIKEDVAVGVLDRQPTKGSTRSR